MPLNTRYYRQAPSGYGPHANMWEDNPHNLIYDLCDEIERLNKLAPHPVPKQTEAQRRANQEFLDKVLWNPKK